MIAIILQTHCLFICWWFAASLIVTGLFRSLLTMCGVELLLRCAPYVIHPVLLLLLLPPSTYDQKPQQNRSSEAWKHVISIRLTQTYDGRVINHIWSTDRINRQWRGRCENTINDIHFTICKHNYYRSWYNMWSYHGLSSMRAQEKSTKEPHTWRWGNTSLLINWPIDMNEYNNSIIWYYVMWWAIV